MKKIALIFTLYMCTAVLVFAQSDIDFEIIEREGAITITKYKGTVRDVRIPERINGLPVTRIGYGAFEGSQITSVTIPSSVTSIGGKAFRDNQLTSVTLPDNVNILTTSFTSFEYCSIYGQYTRSGKTKHTFTFSPPATIGAYEIVTVDNAGIEILKYNGNEKDVRIPERINGLPVIAIGELAFRNNQLTSVTIPNSVTAIGSFSFQGNRLTSITIPNSVTFFGTNAFRGNPLTSITIPNSATVGDWAFALDSLTSITVGANVTLGQNSIGGLESAYNNGGKRAVTYTRPDTGTNEWTVQYR